MSKRIEMANFVAFSRSGKGENAANCLVIRKYCVNLPPECGRRV
jgi:hypothetical protein